MPIAMTVIDVDSIVAYTMDVLLYVGWLCRALTAGFPVSMCRPFLFLF
jgi:hypothetical protein